MEAAREREGKNDFLRFNQSPLILIFQLKNYSNFNYFKSLLQFFLVSSCWIWWIPKDEFDEMMEDDAAHFWMDEMRFHLLLISFKFELWWQKEIFLLLSEAVFELNFISNSPFALDCGQYLFFLVEEGNHTRDELRLDLRCHFASKNCSEFTTSQLEWLRSSSRRHIPSHDWR